MTHLLFQLENVCVAITACAAKMDISKRNWKIAILVQKRIPPCKAKWFYLYFSRVGWTPKSAWFCEQKNGSPSPKSVLLSRVGPFRIRRFLGTLKRFWGTRQRQLNQTETIMGDISSRLWWQNADIYCSFNRFTQDSFAKWIFGNTRRSQIDSSDISGW